MERNYAEGHAFEADIPKTGVFHHRRETRSIWKPAHRFGKIRIRLTGSGDGGADARQEVLPLDQVAERLAAEALPPDLRA